jgi:hypothetical protein
LRRLTKAELRADLVAINDLLNAAKDDLDAQIVAAQRSAISRYLATGVLTIQVTRRMLRLLRRLYVEGQSHAISEAAALGVALQEPRQIPAVALAAASAAPLVRVGNEIVPQRSLRILRVELDAFTRRVSTEALEMQLSVNASALRRELAGTPGARNAASLVVSPAFNDGLASVYGPASRAFEGWQYSSALDSRACGPCVDDDGREFETLAEALDVLPAFGPNPSCHGGTRCRCRLHPIRRAERVADTRVA